MSCCSGLLSSLYVVFMATFLAVMLFFWLELFGDLAAGNMQVSIALWTKLSAPSHFFCEAHELLTAYRSTLYEYTINSLEIIYLR